MTDVLMVIRILVRETRWCFSERRLPDRDRRYITYYVNKNDVCRIKKERMKGGGTKWMVTKI